MTNHRHIQFLNTQSYKSYDYEVEWLESHGSEYIDTLISGNQKASYELKIEIPSIAIAWQQLFAGDRVSSWPRLYSNLPSGTKPFSPIVAEVSGSWETIVPLLPIDAFNVTITIVARDGKLYVDGKKIKDYGYDFYWGTLSPYLMSSHSEGRSAIAKVYYLKMWSDGVLVRDFIPVVKDNVGYMYDKVSNQLFGNTSESGSFTFGPKRYKFSKVLMMLGEKPTTKDYIQDGLIAMWDGKENIGIGKHDNDSKIWVDLIGNRKLALPNGDFFFSNSIQMTDAFDPIDLEFDPTYSSIEMTTEVLEYKTIGWDAKDFGSVFLENTYTPQYNPLNLAIRLHHDSTFACFNSNGQLIKISDMDIQKAIEKASWSKTNSESSFKLKKNNVQQETEIFWTPGSGKFSKSFSTVLIGAVDKNKLVGRIYNLRIYNRPLTDEEVAHNYLIDKIRFRV